MDYEDDLPNLDHWRSVMEFTVEQAALLMAMIDPLDVESVAVASSRRVPRWKNAAAHSLAIVSAIRQGAISPVVCRSREWPGGYSDWVVTPMKPSDRTMEISIADTIITRASLLNWIATEKVQVTRPRPRQVVPTATPRGPEPVTIEAKPEPLALPYHGHKSEGLEFVDDAIKQLWSTYDEDKPGTAPTQREVVEYLRARGAGANMADAVNLVLRPANLRRGNNKGTKVPTSEDQ